MRLAWAFANQWSSFFVLLFQINKWIKKNDVIWPISFIIVHPLITRHITSLYINITHILTFLEQRNVLLVCLNTLDTFVLLFIIFPIFLLTNAYETILDSISQYLAILFLLATTFSIYICRWICPLVLFMKHGGFILSWLVVIYIKVWRWKDFV